MHIYHEVEFAPIQRRSDYDNAEKYYRKATELEPDNTYALYGLGKELRCECIGMETDLTHPSPTRVGGQWDALVDATAIIFKKHPRKKTVE